VWSIRRRCYSSAAVIRWAEAWEGITAWRLAHWRLSPEGGGGVALDLLEEVVDVRRRRELIIPVETQVAVAPVL